MVFPASQYIQALCPMIARQKGTQTIIRLIPNPSASLEYFGRFSIVRYFFLNCHILAYSKIFDYTQNKLNVVKHF